MKKGTKKAFRIGAVASSMGLSMVLAIVIGYGVGFYLDKYFGTEPYLMLLFLIFGIIAAFKNVYTLTKRIERMSQEEE